MALSITLVKTQDILRGWSELVFLPLHERNQINKPWKICQSLCTLYPRTEIWNPAFRLRYSDFFSILSDVLLVHSEHWKFGVSPKCETICRICGAGRGDDKCARPKAVERPRIRQGRAVTTHDYWTGTSPTVRPYVDVDPAFSPLTQELI